MTNENGRKKKFDETFTSLFPEQQFSRVYMNEKINLRTN